MRATDIRLSILKDWQEYYVKTNNKKELKKVETVISELQKPLLSSPGCSGFLTVRQLYNACQSNKYLLLRFDSGYQMGINCKIAAIAQRLNPEKWEKETDFVSYKPCDLNEYIEHKHSFIIS